LGACSGAVLLMAGLVPAQTARMSAILVLRSQAGSIAEEMLGKIGPSLKGIDLIQLNVDGGTSRPLIENAFLESLNRMGIHSALTISAAGRALQVTVLDQGIRYTTLASGDYQREVRTSIEARDVRTDSSATNYLGQFTRSDIDTVALREDAGPGLNAREAERTVWDKLLGPLVVIGGTFLIVYLFFTVRN
jgi:hypothetical protein